MEEKFFGEYLREIRRSKNMSQEDLARNAGISTVYISKVERKNNCVPSDDKVRRLAKSLGENAEEFIKKAHFTKIRLGRMDFLLSSEELDKTSSEVLKGLMQNPQLVELFQEIMSAKEFIKTKIHTGDKEEYAEIIINNLIKMFKDEINLLRHLITFL